MATNNIDEIQKQRRYYAETASRYEGMRGDEHFFGLTFLVAALDYLEVRSVLDIGSGTGRAVSYIRKHRPDVRVLGIEPVAELREVGYAKGLSPADLVDGDATKLEFRAQEFDLVCEFGALHHIRTPEVAVSEMLRVAERAVFIADANNFGQGSPAIRSVKQIINFLGLWPLADFVKTRGKGYMESEGDGIAYSYSVFSSYKQIRAQCKSVHVLNTGDGEINPYKTARHVALLGIKK